MRKTVGVLCMLLGIVMVAGSALLFWQNRMQEQQAGDSAENVLQVLTQSVPVAQVVTEPIHTAQPQETGEPMEMPEMYALPVDGNDYVGYLELPTISLTLPVMSDWSYPKLRVAPCRYAGSAFGDDLVIMAHNYDRHFGRISLLREGDPVQFVDAQGNIHRYVVARQEELGKYDIDEMVNGDWDLTLFSCTYGGRTRVTVRLARVLAYD